MVLHTVKKTLLRTINRFASPFGHKLGALRANESPNILAFPKDFTRSEIEIWSKVQNYTMTSPERIISLIRAVQYIQKYEIPGAIVECGVWRGGSMMAVAHALMCQNILDRELYLYDTFAGMSEPTDDDVKQVESVPARVKWEQSKNGDHNEWCYSSLDEVQSAVIGTGYSADKIHFVKGKIEDTVPGVAPNQIALLRLDTDWYESTRHEMMHLYPRLSPGGVFISDDYNAWKGARKAIDEYCEEHGVTLLLNRIDPSSVIGVKSELIR